jgi:hypothetical protein
MYTYLAPSPVQIFLAVSRDETGVGGRLVSLYWGKNLEK